MSRIFNSVGKIYQSSMDYATFLDKTTSFPKRWGLIRNTSSISHTVLTEKKYPWFLRVGAAENRRRKNCTISSPKRFKNQGTLNGSSKAKVTDNTFSDAHFIRKAFLPICLDIAYLTSSLRKLWGNVNIWVIDGVGRIQHSKWFALRKQFSVHTKRTLEAENLLFDRIICIKQLFPHKALIVTSTTNSIPLRVYHMNIDQSHPESVANILREK